MNLLFQILQPDQLSLIELLELLLNARLLVLDLFFLVVVVVGEQFNFIDNQLLILIQLSSVGIVLSLESQKMFV